MEHRWFKTLWGAVGAGAPCATFADVVPAVAAEQWDGVVYAAVAEQFDPTIGTLEELADRCAEHDLALAVMVHTWGRSLADHLADLDAVLTRATTSSATAGSTPSPPPTGERSSTRRPNARCHWM
jgi:hypothetical protein